MKRFKKWAMPLVATLVLAGTLLIPGDLGAEDVCELCVEYAMDLLEDCFEYYEITGTEDPYGRREYCINLAVAYYEQVCIGEDYCEEGAWDPPGLET